MSASAQLTLPTGVFNSSIYNATFPTAYPTASGLVLVPTGIVSAVPVPLSTGVVNSNGTCGLGSLSLFLGTIRGQEDFPSEFALVFSNGPCGRLNVWPIPVEEEIDETEQRKMI